MSNLAPRGRLGLNYQLDTMKKNEQFSRGAKMYKEDDPTEMYALLLTDDRSWWNQVYEIITSQSQVLPSRVV